MASAAQIEANRRNAQKSVGPSTDAGRNEFRFDALKHGLRAEKAVLPDEDQAALQERLDERTADLQPRNSVEQFLVDRGVRLSWQLDRVFLACFVIRGSTGEPFLEIFHELFTREEVVFRQQAAARQLMAFMPKDAAEARAVLAEIVQHARAQLTAQLKKHQRRDCEIKALAVDRLAFNDSLPGETLRRYEMTSGRALNRTLELLLKLPLAGENAGFATSFAVDPSRSTTTADANVELITTTTVGAKEEIRPAPNEAVEASENAPNEANPTGPRSHQNGWEKFEAWNWEEERGQKPESGITRGELQATQAKNEPVQAEWGYREHQIAEAVLVH